ncbi:hypothetical protein Y032_0014g2311 [Ancylostoma ceylanicum]|uniref:Mos1 transposase HTH domain-containing protein n=1 Tax=Ancylostoma ceylanicum TaxID=53326 RepID=A0A016V8X5_9BILA|nr:hypothetical protein Y032_0014g2311 [Ancylostoma ceylanicum]
MIIFLDHSVICLTEMAKRQHVRVLVLHYFERGLTAAQACKEDNAEGGKDQISIESDQEDHPLTIPSWRHWRSLELWLKRKQLKREDDLKLELSAFSESKKRSFYYYGIRSLAHRWQRVIDHHGS